MIRENPLARFVASKWRHLTILTMLLCALLSMHAIAKLKFMKGHRFPVRLDTRDAKQIDFGEFPVSHPAAAHLITPERYGNFCVYANVLGTESKDKENRILMALHSSLTYIDDGFIKTANSWEGLISISIFAEEIVDEQFPLILKWLLHFQGKLKRPEDVFWQLFFQIDGQECEVYQVDKILYPLKESPFAATSFNPEFYPINVARNLARKFGPPHRYILVADMEQEYSLQAEQRLRFLAESRDIETNRELLVVRRFEHRTGTKAPQSFDELRNGIYRDVFEFHYHYFAVGHRIYSIKKWLQRGENTTHVQEVRKPSKHWEPMFVASASIPYHDEGLIYQYMNHLAMRWDLCAMQYKFMVADGVFNTHEGIKELRLVGGYKWQSKKQYKEGKAAAERHKARLIEMYPLTAPACIGDKPKNETATS